LATAGGIPVEVPALDFYAVIGRLISRRLYMRGSFPLVRMWIAAWLIRPILQLVSFYGRRPEMLIRNHPELKSWCPQSGVACPPPFPTVEVLAHLVVKDIVYKGPAKLEFVLAYGAGRCAFVKEFKDQAFAAALHESRQKCIGKPLGAMGEINIKYRRSASLPLHLLFEPY